MTEYLKRGWALVRQITFFSEFTCKIKCENFILGCTVFFRAILDERLTFITLDENWTAHAPYLCVRSRDAMYGVRESKSRFKLFYRLFMDLFCHFLLSLGLSTRSMAYESIRNGRIEFGSAQPFLTPGSIVCWNYVYVKTSEPLYHLSNCSYIWLEWCSLPHSAPFCRVFLYFSKDSFGSCLLVFLLCLREFSTYQRWSKCSFISYWIKFGWNWDRRPNQFSQSQLIWVGLNSNSIPLMWSTASKPV